MTEASGEGPIAQDTETFQAGTLDRDHARSLQFAAGRMMYKGLGFFRVDIEENLRDNSGPVKVSITINTENADTDRATLFGIVDRASVSLSEKRAAGNTKATLRGEITRIVDDLARQQRQDPGTSNPARKT